MEFQNSEYKNPDFHEISNSEKNHITTVQDFSPSSSSYSFTPSFFPFVSSSPSPSLSSLPLHSPSLHPFDSSTSSFHYPSFVSASPSPSPSTLPAFCLNWTSPSTLSSDSTDFPLHLSPNPSVPCKDPSSHWPSHSHPTMLPANLPPFPPHILNVMDADLGPDLSPAGRNPEDLGPPGLGPGSLPPSLPVSLSEPQPSCFPSSSFSSSSPSSTSSSSSSSSSPSSSSPPSCSALSSTSLFTSFSPPELPFPVYPPPFCTHTGSGGDKKRDASRDRIDTVGKGNSDSFESCSSSVGAGVGVGVGMDFPLAPPLPHTPPLPPYSHLPPKVRDEIYKNRCTRCKGFGHMSRQCPFPDTRFCYTCRQLGHIARNCPYKQASAETYLNLRMSIGAEGRGGEEIYQSREAERGETGTGEMGAGRKEGGETEEREGKGESKW